MPAILQMLAHAECMAHAAAHSVGEKRSERLATVPLDQGAPVPGAEVETRIEICSDGVAQREAGRHVDPLDPDAHPARFAARRPGRMGA